MTPNRNFFNSANRWIRGLMLCFIGALSLSAFAQSAVNPPLLDRTLPNGVRVIIKPDHRAPTVSHTVWYQVGSIDEPSGQSGISHMLEHMMFKGTHTIGEGEFSKRVAQSGGRDNAFTSTDNTVYFQLIPKDSLPSMMQLEADRMVNLKLQEESFNKERQVVIEERRLRTEDNPGALFWERLQAHRWITHPYRNPIIGWMHDIESLRLADLEKWYRQYYSPSNATVIIVGDVNAEETWLLAEKIYGAVKDSKTPTEFSASAKKSRDGFLANDLPSWGAQRLDFHAAVHLPEIILSYRAPKLQTITGEATPYALMLLSVALDGYEGAIFPQKFVREQKIATDINVSYDPIKRGPTQWLISANPTEKTSLSQLEKAIRQELIAIAEKGIGEEELKRAKNQLKAQSIFKRDSLFAQALEIGEMVINGFAPDDHSLIEARLQTIRAEEIKNAARAVLVDSGLIVGQLIPNGEKPAPTPSWKGR